MLTFDSNEYMKLLNMFSYILAGCFVLFVCLLEFGVFDKEVRVSENALLPDYVIMGLYIRV